MPETQSSVIETVVPLHLDQQFSYRVPVHLLSAARPGVRVLVPFGRRTVTAYLLGYGDPAATIPLREIIDVLDQEPLWTPQELEFFRWVASYYLHPLGDVLKAALPAGINLKSATGEGEVAGRLTGGRRIRREAWYRLADGAPVPQRIGSKAAQVLEAIRGAGEASAAELTRRFGPCSPQLGRLQGLGLIIREEREVCRDLFRDMITERDVPRQLNACQQAVLSPLCAALDAGLFAPFLLHGVTGSGKTEIYLQAIAHCLDHGGNALVLVPEIALTPQTVRRFSARFGDVIAILHSALSDGDRYDEWRRIRRGEARIVIGARSAIFAPLERIGIIVVDEEHEASFKQNEGLRYNARDLALVRGRMERSVVLLGSATPLITSIHAATHGRLTLLSLPERVEARPMPDVEICSLRDPERTISPLLARALEETVAAGQQAMIFLNRRGFHTFLVCADCGARLTCPNCTVTLTFHRNRGQSLCHYCDYAVPAPGVCPACNSLRLKELGAGTERVEHEVRELLPDASIVRLDSDTAVGRGSHERILSRMVAGGIDVLVGTQMIAKGHDFPGVTLVGIVNADADLGLPDFRATERTFQLISQVTGRAGRGAMPGRVVIQTALDDHYAIRCAAEHDYDRFCRQETEFRREAGYPPYAFLASLGFSGTSEDVVLRHSEMAGGLLQGLKRDNGLRVELLGPAPAPFYRLRGRFRRQILLKSADRSTLRRLIILWRGCRKGDSRVREVIDIDPVNMM
jgi:primosomal protein N' (replication factor Y)